MCRRLIMSALAVLCISSFSVHAATAPQVHIRSLSQLPTPLPKPYEDGANANAQVQAGLALAKTTGKRLLIDFGGNWCPDCLILAGVMNLPEVKPFVDEHFEVVSVDVGRFNKNLDVVKALHIKQLFAVPWLVIAEADGSIIASSYEITDQRHKTPQSMVDWLARYATDR